MEDDDVKTTTISPTFNSTLDISHGVLYLICFLVGTLGNIASFIFFRIRKRDTSNWIYQLITINDTVICLCVLPIGLSYLSARSPGMTFGTDWSCILWSYTWLSNRRLSVFLVVVLCSSRTWSLLRPFSPQRTRVVLAVVLVYFLLTMAQLVGMNLDSFHVEYDRVTVTCSMISKPGSLETQDEWISIALEVAMIVTFCLPLFVVIISCTISTYLLGGNKNDGMECSSPSSKRLIDSRHKASVTIIIFSVVYGFFNIPLVLFLMIGTVEYYTGRPVQDTVLYFDTKGPEYHFYFGNYMFTMSTVLNSVLNPLLYLWRMPGCIKAIHKCMKKFARKSTRRLRTLRTL